MGVISIDERESVWSEKNSEARAAPTNQQNITVLQRMICSEGAVKESTLGPQRCRATRSCGGARVRISISNAVKYSTLVLDDKDRNMHCISELASHWRHWQERLEYSRKDESHTTTNERVNGNE